MLGSESGLGSGSGFMVKVTVELGFRVRISASLHLAGETVICFKFRLLNNGPYVFIIRFWGQVQAAGSKMFPIAEWEGLWNYCVIAYPVSKSPVP